MLEQLKRLTNFEYCFKTEGNPEFGLNPDCYQFGWKNGLHFYIDDYFENTETEGRYVMIVYSNKLIILNEYFYEIKPLIKKIQEFL